ncbi:hypothetical protein CUMW_199740 [Citrus unshiu]|nr:hypothetical protein CUMW_199740 [Citrus unshiu]
MDIWHLSTLTTCDFSEKLDVYSFGAFLSELLTGRGILDLVRDAHDLVYPFNEYLKNYFLKIIDLLKIVDPIIVQDLSCTEKEQQLHASAQLTFECLNESPIDRPTMVDVARRLRQIYCSLSCGPQ